MPTIVQFRRGTEAQSDAFTGNVGELSVDTTNETVRVHDGSTAGGSRLATHVEVSDRIQVANARVEFLQSSNTSINGDATSITVQQSNVDLEDRALVNPAGFITLNIGGTDYKLPFFS